VFSRTFPEAGLTITALGNVLVNTAFLHGLAADEITPADYAVHDPYFPMLVTVRAQKPGGPLLVWDRSAHILRSRADGSHTGSAVLLYHRVASPDTDVHRLAVSAAEFRDHINWLRHEYNVLPLEDLVAAAVDGGLPPGAVAITFDDGCIDNLTVAAPILAEFDAPATYFVATDALTEPYEFWWTTLERLFFAASPLLPAATPASGLPVSVCSLPTDTPEARRAAHDAVYRTIADAPADDRDEVVARLREWAGDPGIDASARRMTATEVLALSKLPGQSIGAHTARHLMLPRQPRSVVEREVEESRQTLANLLGRDIRTFAYPFGAADAVARSVVQGAGFTVAMACGDAAVPRHVDALAVPRLDPCARGGETFRDWMQRRVGVGRSLGRIATVAVQSRVGSRRRGGARRALVAGWFSYTPSDFTAGDLLACDLVGDWLREGELDFDVALASPLAGGVSLDAVDPAAYTHAVFVCGPFMRNDWEEAFVARFRGCRLIGVNLSMPVPVDQWQPFDVLLARNSSLEAQPDIVFGTQEPAVPVVGVCLVDAYGGADVVAANATIATLLRRRHVAVVPIDTRLDVNVTGLRTKAEVASLLGRMDVVVTTRLHGMVLALKQGVPALVIDPEPGGVRVKRQADAIGWPVAFTVDTLDPEALEKAFDYCLAAEARALAAECATRAIEGVDEIRRRFLEAIAG
jgi:peptidoglycan/xylan/chitin deacetylase (PgdA/CDA1 family)